jgi:hypothetical protein
MSLYLFGVLSQPPLCLIYPGGLVLVEAPRLVRFLMTLPSRTVSIAYRYRYCQIFSPLLTRPLYNPLTVPIVYSDPLTLSLGPY